MLDEPCRAERLVQLLAGRWTLAVLAELANGGRRYQELHDVIDGISHKVLTATVRHLEAHGLIEREVGSSAASCVWYSLTQFGETVRPILAAMITWGSQRLAAPSAGC